VIGHQKGHGTADLIAHNFGMPEPAGYHKARRLMSYAARFAMPVVTLVDTPGAYPGVSAEERGQGSVIAHCIMEMSRLPVPTVAVIIGEGGSGGALALAAADRVLMLQNAVYSVISPEGCSSILFGTAERAAEAAQALRLCAVDLLRLDIVDGIVREPVGGAHTDPPRAAAALRDAVVAELRHLGTLTADELADTRYARFRRIGDPRCQPSLREEDAA
jgi:acetyl-CoA carboxylase carboxyl transferase alpha subunit